MWRTSAVCFYMVRKHGAATGAESTFRDFVVRFWTATGWVAGAGVIEWRVQDRARMGSRSELLELLHLRWHR